MIAVIFEVWPADGRKQTYLDIAASLKPELEKIDGFLSIERFQSLTDNKEAPLALLLARRGGGQSLAQHRAPPSGPAGRARRRAARLSPARGVGAA
jgi:hypothetical protein